MLELFSSLPALFATSLQDAAKTPIAMYRKIWILKLCHTQKYLYICTFVFAGERPE